MNTGLRRRLLEMIEDDERVRAELAATGELFQGYVPRMAEVHERNARQLARMIGRHGWLSESLVGADGAEAAWIILQHAIGDPALQRKCLPLLKEAVAHGDAPPAHAAYLEDRICFFERRSQRYGTQFDWDDAGRMSPWALEDPERVDEHRRAVVLPPLAERIEQTRKAAEGAGNRNR